MFTVGQRGGLHKRSVVPCLGQKRGGAGMGGRHAEPASTDPVMGTVVLTLVVLLVALIILAMS